MKTRVIYTVSIIFLLLIDLMSNSLSGSCELKVLLEEEKQKRRAAERLLEEVKRECKEPFVVPALLEAFSLLSQTSHKIRSEH
jgi:hypothetical protein